MSRALLASEEGEDGRRSSGSKSRDMRKASPQQQQQKINNNSTLQKIVLTDGGGCGEIGQENLIRVFRPLINAYQVLLLREVY